MAKLGKLEELEQQIDYLKLFLVDALKLSMVDVYNSNNESDTYHFMTQAEAESWNKQYHVHLYPDSLYYLNGHYFTKDFQEVKITVFTGARY